MVEPEVEPSFPYVMMAGDSDLSLYFSSNRALSKRLIGYLYTGCQCRVTETGAFHMFRWGFGLNLKKTFGISSVNVFFTLQTLICSLLESATSNMFMHNHTVFFLLYAVLS